jgi:hypothetical protein
MPVFGLNQIVMLYCYIGPSLIGFNLASVMATQAYVSVRMTATQKTPNQFPVPVIFDQVASASAHFWNLTSSALRVTYAGAYFISSTIEVPHYAFYEFRITINQVPKAMLDFLDFTTNEAIIRNGIMSGRTACMLQLNVGDVLAITAYSGTEFYGSADGVSNMQAFLYSPQTAIGAPVAWSVASVFMYRTFPGIVGYDLVHVNIGNAWNPSINATIIPASGTYLIDVTSCVGDNFFCRGGNPGNWSTL